MPLIEPNDSFLPFYFNLSLSLSHARSLACYVGGRTVRLALDDGFFFLVVWLLVSLMVVGGSGFAIGGDALLVVAEFATLSL